MISSEDRIRIKTGRMGPERTAHPYHGVGFSFSENDIFSSLVMR